MLSATWEIVLFRFCAAGCLILTAIFSFIPSPLQAAEPSFYPAFNELSFLYDGVLFSPETFTCSVTPAGENSEYTQKNVVYLARDGKLQIRVDYKLYKNYPVFEYTVWLANLSETEETGLVENFNAIHTSIPFPVRNRNLILDAVTGSTCVPSDFTPKRFTVEPGKTESFLTDCGRSSNDYFPFLEWTLDGPISENYHCMLAIGWTGSWTASFTNKSDAVEITAGMVKTHFRLAPKESVRQPSVALFLSDMGEQDFRTMVHRFMVNVKSPRDTEGNVIPPIMALGSGGGNKTPEMARAIIDYSVENKLPFDTFWVDAGWHGKPHETDPYPNCGPDWWSNVGNWIVNTVTHPTGTLLPIANAAHQAGMKFLLWFEPERVHPDSDAAVLKEHPEYINGHLFDFGNPEALALIQNAVFDLMRSNRVDIYREDFNIPPQPVWDSIDAKNPDRTGLAEAKHISGLYEFLDNMRREFPGLLQENCAGGGRRLDMEMISRAHSYCRSDYFIFPKEDDSAFIMGQNATHNTLPYLPFQGGESNCVTVGDEYGMMSVLSSGNVFTPSDFDGGVIRRPFTPDETAWFKKMFDIAARMNKLYMGDFYQLTPNTGTENNVWCAWQLFDPQKKEGFAIAFRRAEAPDAEHTFELRQIDPDKVYEVEAYNGVRSEMKGKELAEWQLHLEPRSFALLFFKER
ncbi:MAG: alpha-galactosidase [Thermoguttaceae bacterium]|nr:alpha-galactosidase [Thermoguttaceae bacterium]